MDVVLVDGSVRLDVHDRLRVRGIDEIQRACLEDIAVSHEYQIAPSEVHAAYKHRFCCRPTYLQVCCALQAQLAGGQVELVGGLHCDIELHLPAEALCRCRIASG